MELFFICLLVLASVIGVTFIVERGLALRWKNVIPKPVEEQVAAVRTPESVERLKSICAEHPSPLSRLLLLAISLRDWPKSENAEAVQTRARYEITRLERGLVFLEIVVGIAPLLGLVGTVYGLIILFKGTGLGGMADQATLARGIATALNATFLGLMAAIPALVGWSYYNKKIETLAVEMETVCDEFLKRYYHVESPGDPVVATGAPQTLSPLKKGSHGPKNQPGRKRVDSPISTAGPSEAVSQAPAPTELPRPTDGATS